MLRCQKKLSVIIYIPHNQTHSLEEQAALCPFLRETQQPRISFSSRICLTNNTALNPKMAAKSCHEYQSQWTIVSCRLTFRDGVHLGDGFDKGKDLQRVVDLVSSFSRWLLHNSRVHFFPSLVASSEVVLGL